MSKVDLFVHGQLSKNGYFTCIFGVVHYPIPIIGYKQDSSSNESNVPQSVAHLICVPQVPQMWHKMWHNSIYILSTNFTNGDQIFGHFKSSAQIGR